MKYEFIVRVYNSTIIEVEADSAEIAFELAEKMAYDVSGDLCNPSDLEVECEFNREVEDEE